MHTEEPLRPFFSSLCMTGSIPTWESDVESLVGHREVREEADLRRVVSKQARAERWRQRGARQSPQRLWEAAVLGHQQMVVRALQVERVKGELDPWTLNKNSVTKSHSLTCIG